MTENTIFNHKNTGNIYKNVSKNKKVSNVESVLVDMLHDYYRWDKYKNREQAVEIARKLEHYVTTYEHMTMVLEGNYNGVIEAYLQDVRKQPAETRERILKEVAFGLDAWREDKLVEKLKQGFSVERLYADSCYNRYDNEMFSAELLEEEVREKLKSFHLSPKALNRMTEELEKSNAPVVTAAALGQESHDLKCIAAMELFLSEEGRLDMETAAYATCATVEMQAVADAVHKGEIAEKVASVLVVIAAIAAVLLLAHYFPLFLHLNYELGLLALPVETNVLAMHLAAQAETIRNGMIVGVGVFFLGVHALQKLPELLARMPKLGAGLLQQDTEAISDGYCRMILCGENELQAEVDLQAELDLQDEDMEIEEEEELEIEE